MTAPLLRRSPVLRAAPVSVVAAWDGWCGACADERPLVLTRTGRRTFASWWAGLGDDHLPLTLTCRLCGVGVDVPLHEDEDEDPEPVVEAPAAVVELPVQRSAAVVLPVDQEDDTLALLAAGWPA